MTHSSFIYKIIVVITLFTTVVLACKKQDIPAICEVENLEVFVDPNFALFPKTGGLWVYKSEETIQPFNIVTDTFIIGNPIYKSAYRIPDTTYKFIYSSDTPSVNLYYPVLRTHTLQNSDSTFLSINNDTIFFIREDLAKNIVYRTIKYNGRLYDVVHMNYNAQPGNGAMMYVSNAVNNSWYFNYTKIDSIYFNKRYLKRYYTMQTEDRIIQGFQPVLGAYQIRNFSPKQFKAFYYNGDSIVQRQF